MINKIDFKAKNLTSNAGLFLLLENAKSNGIFDFTENDLVFDNDSTNKIKMNHIKTMLCGHFIGIDIVSVILSLYGLLFFGCLSGIVVTYYMEMNKLLPKEEDQK